MTELNQRDPARINEVQTRLQQVQKSEHAWVVADSLLQSDSSDNHRFMGALAFLVKINVSWYGESLATALYDSFLFQIYSHSSQIGMKLTRMERRRSRNI